MFCLDQNIYDYAFAVMFAIIEMRLKTASMACCPDVSSEASITWL